MIDPIASAPGWSDPSFLGFGGKGNKGKGKRKGNPRGRDGQPMTCHSCGSEDHLVARCPCKDSRDAHFQTSASTSASTATPHESRSLPAPSQKHLLASIRPDLVHHGTGLAPLENCGSRSHQRSYVADLRASVQNSGSTPESRQSPEVIIAETWQHGPGHSSITIASEGQWDTLQRRPRRREAKRTRQAKSVRDLQAVFPSSSTTMFGAPVACA